MTTKDRISLTIDSEILEKIDQVRGLVPRATFLNAKLREIFAPSTGGA